MKLRPGVAAFCVGISVLALATPAQATATCGTSGNFFDGTDPRATTSYAVTASIGTKTPGLCGASDSDSSIWTMLADGGGGGYAQSGYGRSSGQSTIHIFAEYKKCDTCAFVRKEFDPPANSNASYSQEYDSTAKVILMKFGSTTLLKTNFDPVTQWSSPWVPQWEAETHRNGDDVPGSAASPVVFGGMKIKTCKTCSYTTPTGMTVSSDSSRYGVAWETQNSRFSVWTK